MALHPSITQVKGCIAEEQLHTAFPEPIERLYQEKLTAYRAKALHTGILPMLIVFNLFLILEASFFSDMLVWASVLHVLISMWIVAVGFVLRHEPRPIIRELSAVSISVLIVLYVLMVFISSDVSARDHCHYLAVAVIIDMNINARPAFPTARATSIGLYLLYALALVFGNATPAACAIGMSLMAAAVYVSLVANFRMSSDSRRAFLRRLLDQLLREEAEQEAGRDPLTGLANRRRVESNASSFWNDPANASGSVAVILIDVDHFKAYNDHYGHLKGDRCLTQIAQVLDEGLRSQHDTASRFGGEEFLLLLTNATLPEAKHVAEGIRVAVERLAIAHASRLRRVTVSLGVAAGPVSRFSFEELTAAADTALYAAKRDGRNRVWPPVGRAPGDEVHQLPRRAG